MILLVFLLLTLVNGAAGEGVCHVRPLDTPIAAKDGDFIIGGMFQIGELQYTSDNNGTRAPVQYCSYDNMKEFRIQKAIVLRMVIDRENEKFKRDFNKTLGYEMYDCCMSSAITSRASFKLASNSKVVGVSGVDFKSFVKRSASVTTSYHIPTFVYLFNDGELMDDDMFPTLFSMIDTEVNEAEITIRFLEKMGYQYMDIWYHKFSKDMAEHIYNSYVKKVGCGRITDVTSVSDIPRIKQTYNETGGSPAQVQLILQNSGTTTAAMLKEMVGNLGFRNKIYILGLSNGRFRYLDGLNYTEILSTSGDNTVILPLPDLLNTELKQTPEYFNKDWRLRDKRDYIDDIFANVQNDRCPKDGDEPQDCRTTSWLPYMIGGVQLILDTLHASLAKNVAPNSGCLMDYKTELFNEIVNENRTLEVRLEENVTVLINIFNKTVNIGYKIGVYRTNTKTFASLGRAFFDRIDITDEDLLKSIPGYNKTCSHTCKPGTRRLFDESVQYVPCCWICNSCKLNQYSTEYDANVCKTCDTSMSSNENHTDCVLTGEIYIRPHSTIFLVGASCIPLGVAMVIVFGVLIFRNENRPIVKASDPAYLYMLLLSLLIGYLVAYTSILKPSKISCAAEYYSFVIFATMISVNLLYRCMKVYVIFAAAQNFTAPKLGLLLKRTGQTAINLFALGVTVIMLIIDFFTGDGTSWTFKRYQEINHTPWYLACTSDKLLNLMLPMVIPGLSFLITLILAFKMRQFPHNFRESLNIFCATFVVLLCSIMFLTGYSYSPPEVQSVLRAIVIFVTSSAFLLCIFIPKIVLLLNKKVSIEEERQQIREKVQKFSTACDPKMSIVKSGQENDGQEISVTLTD